MFITKYIQIFIHKSIKRNENIRMLCLSLVMKIVVFVGDKKR